MQAHLRGGWMCDELSGSYGANQLKTLCVEINDDVHADVEVKRIGGAGSLTKDECWTYLLREVEGCPHGGRRYYDNWMFRCVMNLEGSLFITYSRLVS